MAEPTLTQDVSSGTRKRGTSNLTRLVGGKPWLTSSSGVRNWKLPHRDRAEDTGPLLGPGRQGSGSSLSTGASLTVGPTVGDRGVLRAGVWLLSVASSRDPPSPALRPAPGVWAALGTADSHPRRTRGA